MSKEKTMNFWRQQKDIIAFVIVGVVIIGLLVLKRGVVNNNEGLVMVIVTTVLVLTTMYYSLLNQLLLAATDSPKVILAIRPWNTGKKQYVFVMENVGTGIAFDTKLKVLGQNAFMLNETSDLMNTCTEIKVIPPKQDYKLLIETEGWTAQQRKMSFDIKVSYTNSQGRKLPPEQFSLSIEASHYYLQGDLVAERLGEIVDHIETIANQSSAPKDTKDTSNQSLNPDNAKSNTPTIDDQIEKENLEKKELSKAQ